jgi:hypothetical protein
VSTASTAKDMVTLLVAASQGTEGGTLFANIMPDKPKACVAVFDSPSAPVVYAHGMSPVNQKRRVQIQSRHPDPEQANAKCQAAVDALAARQAVVVSGGGTYEMIVELSSTTLLGRDDNGMPIFYAELEATIDLG